MSLFFVDSSCDLGHDQIKKLGIECIDLKYSINDKEFDIADDFDFNKFYSKVRKGVVLNYVAKKEEDFLNVFKPILESGEDIIYIYSSSKLLDSAGVLSAKDKLKDEFPEREIAVVDSSNMSIGYGLVCYLLAMQYRNGLSVQEIVEYSNKIKDEIALYMLVDSLEGLSVRGLIDSKMVSGTALNIKPIIAVDIDGAVQMIDKVSGKKKAIQKLIEILRQRGENVVDYPIAICYSGVEKDAVDMADKIKEYFGDDIQILVSPMMPSSTSIVGLGAIGVAFHVHKKMN